MKRRDFVIATVATVVAVAIPAVNYSYRPKKDSGDAVDMPDILERFCNEEEIRKIGISYRTITPSENTKEKITALLLATDEKKSEGSLSKSEIAKLLEQKIHREFAGYKTIVVDGWVITPTEARQCALFSLTHN